MASAMELMWPGVPVTACATIQPRRSKTPAERSPASRTMEVNDVRMSAAACSLTTPISRFQQMSRVIGSITRLPRLEDQGQAVVHADARAGAGHGGGLALLDDGGPGRAPRPVYERVAVVELGVST